MKFFFFLLAATVVAGQPLFRDLAASPAGDELYFVSSLRLKGSEQTPHGKLFRLAPAGLELVEALPGPGELTGTGVRLSNFYEISQPMLDANGRLLAYTLFRQCASGPICNQLGWGLWSRGEVLESLRIFAIAGNGRFAGTTSRTSGPFSFAGVYDLGTRQLLLTAQFGGTTNNVVTPDGHLLYEAQGKIYRDNNVLVDERFAGTALGHPERAGALVTGDTLRWFDADTGRFRVIAAQKCEQARWGGGDWFVALCGGQLWRGEISQTTPLSRVNLPAHEIDQFAAARRGEVIWFAGQDASVYRYDAALDETRLVLQAPPSLAPHVAMAPGRALTLNGTELTPDLRVWIDGLPAPILAVTPTQVTLQVPWRARSRVTVPWRVELPQNQSPFEFIAPESVGLGGAQFVTPAIRHDWSGWVTAARPGEHVHFYGAGFGLPAPELPDGVAAPVGSVLPLRDPLTCEVQDQNGTRPLRVVWAGLAPGLIGFHQITLETIAWRPAPGVTGSLQVNCAGARQTIPMIVE